MLSIIFGTGSLAWGYMDLGLPTVVNWIGILGAAWLVAMWRRWRWFSVLGLFLCILLAVIGLWLGLRMDRMFAGAIFALAAWDLTEFRRKRKQLSPREDAKGMERRHVLRISLLSAGGILIALLLDRLW